MFIGNAVLLEVGVVGLVGGRDGLSLVTVLEILSSRVGFVYGDGDGDRAFRW